MKTLSLRMPTLGLSPVASYILGVCIALVCIFFAQKINSIYAIDSFLPDAEMLSASGIIAPQRSADGYRLGASVTRAEVAKMLVGATESTVTPPTCQGGLYKDVSSSLGDLCGYIERARTRGIVSPNPQYRPMDPITRAEMAKMVIGAWGMPVDACDPKAFGDVPGTAPLCGYVTTALHHGIITHNNNFRPDDAITRGEAFRMIRRILSDKTLSIKDTTRSTVTKGYTFALDFPVAMKKDAVLSALRMYPDTPHTLSWQDDRHATLQISDDSLLPQTYTVNISSTTATLTGGTLGMDIIRSFRTDGVPDVSFVQPDGRIDSLSLPITVRFSQPMVALTTLDHQPPCPLTITPTLSGSCVWITTSTFQYRIAGGWPVGGHYSISVPSGLATITGDRTVGGRTWTIDTTPFTMNNPQTTLRHDEPFILSFNAPVSVDAIRKSFHTKEISDSNLSIMPSQTGATEDSTFRILPPSGDYGYGRMYTYSIDSTLTSARGNVPLGDGYKGTFWTRDLLTDSHAFVFVDPTVAHPYLHANIHTARDMVIPHDNPKILLTFDDPVPLDASLIHTSVPFTLARAETTDCTMGTCSVVLDTKTFIIETKATGLTSLSVNILLSQVAHTQDRGVSFTTTDDNSITNFQSIDYRSACVDFAHEMGDADLRVFDTGGSGSVDGLSQVYQYSQITGCPYDAGKHRYLLSARFTPATTVNLKIAKSLLDVNNLPLDKEYTEIFTTPVARAEDKSLTVPSHQDTILMPTGIHPISLPLLTTNINTVSVNICTGDLDPTATDLLKNKTCASHDVSVRDLGFRSELSVVDLERLYGTGFTSPVVSVAIDKENTDKTDYELKGDGSIRTTYIRSDVSAVLRMADHAQYLWLTDVRTGAPLTDAIARIDDYTVEPHYNLFGSYTGNQPKLKGTIAATQVSPWLYSLDHGPSGRMDVVLRSGEHVIVDTSSSVGTDPTVVYVHTERPLYHAGDTVHISGIARLHGANGYTIEQRSFPIVVRSPQYTEVARQTVTPDRFGAFSIDVALLQDTPLGQYNINIEGSNNLSMQNNGDSFSVEEFVKPTFEAGVKIDKNMYHYGDTMSLTVTGAYYAGAPLVGWKGTYLVSARDFVFAGGKTTGYDWGIGSDRPWMWWVPYRPSYDTTITSGSYTLDTAGRITIALPLANTSGTGATDRTYTISTTTSDPDGHSSVSAETTAEVLRATAFVGLKTDQYIYTIGDTARIGFVTVDRAGDPVSSRDIVFTATRITYGPDPVTLQYTSQETIVSTGTLTTDSQGLASQTLTITDAGQYHLSIRLADGTYETTRTIYVSGAGLTQPKESQHDLAIFSDKETYKVGDTAQFTIASPYSGTGVHALVTIEQGSNILDARVIDIGSPKQTLSLPVARVEIPAYTVHATVVRGQSDATALVQLQKLRADMQVLEQSLGSNPKLCDVIIYDLAPGWYCTPIGQPVIASDSGALQLADMRKKEITLLQSILPDYLDGSTDVHVSTDPVHLSITATPDSPTYAPWAPATITLHVTDSDGHAVNGIATLALVDDALLALMPDHSDILGAFYMPVSSSVGGYTNLQNLPNRLDWEQMENRSHNNTNVPDGAMYDLGATTTTMAPAPMAGNAMVEKSAESGNSSTPVAPHIRTDFRDLAYYTGSVVLSDGTATISVKNLPEDLTRWRIVGYAADASTRVGDFSGSLSTQTPLSVIANIPQVFVSADETELVATLLNRTDSDLSIAPSLDMTHVTVLESPASHVSVPAHSGTVVRWRVRIADMPTDIDWSRYVSDIRLSAVSTDGPSDALSVSRHILPYSTPEYTFTAGSMTGAMSYADRIVLPSDIDPTQWKIDITMASTLLAHLPQDWSSFVYMPSDDGESLVHIMATTAILHRLAHDLGDLSYYTGITVVDRDQVSHTLDSVVKEAIAHIGDYIQSDGGIAYSRTCEPWFNNSCSDFELSGRAIRALQSLQNEGFTIDSDMVGRIKGYYTTALQSRIDTLHQQGQTFDDVGALLVLADFSDEKNILTNGLKDILAHTDALSSEDRATLVLVLQRSGLSTDVVPGLVRTLENNLFIEARGTFLPPSITSTARGLSALLSTDQTDTLTTDNMVRWLIAMRSENNRYGSSSDTEETLWALVDFVEATGDGKDVNFTAKGMLDSRELISHTFSSDRRFETATGSYSLSGTLNILNDTGSVLGWTKDGSGTLWYDVGLRYFLPIDQIAPRDEGIVVDRAYYRYDDYVAYRDAQKPCMYYVWDTFDSIVPCQTSQVAEPTRVSSGAVGDTLVGTVTIILPQTRHHVSVEDYIPAGAEILNPAFSTTSSQVKNISDNNNGPVAMPMMGKMSGVSSPAYYGGYMPWSYGLDRREIHGDHLTLSADELPAGVYTATYVLRLDYAGHYHHRPATAEDRDRPEIWGRSSGEWFDIRR